MKKHDLIIIGAGPGGYVAAIRAAQLGMDVACVDRNTALGGTCLRIGCIPSKALLEDSELYWAARNDFPAHGIEIPEVRFDLAAMLRRKEQVVTTLTRGIESLFKKNRITRYMGTARIIGPGRVTVAGQPGAGGEQVETLEANNVIIATGSVPAGLPGIDFDGDLISTSTEALAYGSVPEHLVVVGAGYIGLEMGTVWHRLGAKVTIIEYLDRILPGMDTEIAQEAQRIFTKQGLEFRLGCRLQSVQCGRDGCVATVEGAEPIRADRVLVCVGRMPNTAGLGLETVNIQLDEKGRIPVDGNFATRAAGFYAIGDCIRGPMLAHKAEEEGIACAEYLAGRAGEVNYQAIPAVVYTNPEIASVGQTEDELKQSGVAYKKGVFQFRGNGRARALGQIDGRIKVLADADSDRLLGVHIIGPRAGDLIAEGAVAISFGASSEDLARCSHAHPTLAEALREAALAVDGRAIHA